MNILDITFDLETTALTPNAAVLSIGAVAWDRYAMYRDEGFTHNPFLLENKKKTSETSDFETDFCSFQRYIDLRSQFVNGFDFDNNTARWWSNQRQEAKDIVCSRDVLAESIEDAARDFFDWIKAIEDEHDYAACNLWSQGSDFDIAIMRNVVSKFFTDTKFPIDHVRFRDARTYILEMGRLIAEDDENAPEGLKDVGLNLLRDKPNQIYKFLPDMPEEWTDGIKAVPHTSLFDSIRSTWNVYTLMHHLAGRLGDQDIIHPDKFQFKNPFNDLMRNH